MTQLKMAAQRWWLVILLLLVWQLVTLVQDVDATILPAPDAIAARIVSDPLLLLVPLAQTLSTSIIGFAAGVSAGALMATVTWLWRPMASLIVPIAVIMQSIPFVVIAPVLTPILGFSRQSAWIIVLVACFFPTFVLVSSGLRAVPANGNDLFTIAGASTMDRFRRLAVPSALPALGTSIRISATTAVVAALVAEFLMGVPGIALVLVQALSQLDTTQVWASSAVVAAAATMVYLMATSVETQLSQRWS